MKLIQKVIYAIFLVVGIGLILFALGIIDGDDLGIEPIQNNNIEMQDPSDGLSEGDENEDIADEDQDDINANDQGNNEELFPEVTTTVTIIDEGDSSSQLFLSYNYESFEDAVYTFSMAVEQNIQGVEGAEDQRTEQLIDGTFDVTADLEDDNNLVGTYQFIDFDINVFGNEFIEQQLGEALATFREGFLGSWYDFEVDNTGNIVSIEIGTDGNMMQDLSFVEQFTEMVRDGFFLLPGGTVGEGGSWELVRSIDTPGASVINVMVFTVESVSAGQATINIEVTQTVDGEDIGFGSGRAVIEESSPFPVNLSMSTSSNFSVPMQQQGSIEMEQIITTEILKIQ